MKLISSKVNIGLVKNVIQIAGSIRKKITKSVNVKDKLIKMLHI